MVVVSALGAGALWERQMSVCVSIHRAFKMCPYLVVSDLGVGFGNAGSGLRKAEPAESGREVLDPKSEAGLVFLRMGSKTGVAAFFGVLDCFG